MFEKSKALFIYCVSPVHAGAGTALGVIDNPIQRERHTDYPMIASSGFKGAVRHHFWSQLDDGTRKDKANLLNRLFGPETDASDHAGAISFGDAQLVAFPVRSVKRAFVYVTSPTALARTKRLLQMLGIVCNWLIPEVKAGFCRVVENKGPAGNNETLHLEAFESIAIDSNELTEIAQFLAEIALPGTAAYTFFRDKLATDLVLLPDEEFGYFVRNATVVEPHVRINNKSGTADDGGLFYTENLPPESLLIAPVMASVERYHRERKPASLKTAEEVLQIVLHGDGNGFGGLDERLLQIGGDATTGRGQVILKVAGGV
ncbi:MAG: CRISPR-associated protein Cmr4 [Pseudomonadota bacterium]|nr:CRISPR-associated protein Cmr4 [Pseudomonadota bacterium]